MSQKSQKSFVSKLLIIVGFGIFLPIAFRSDMAVSQQSPQATGPEQMEAVGCDGVLSSGKTDKGCGCGKPAPGICGCSPCPEAPTATPTFTPTCGVFIGEVTANPNGDMTRHTFDESFPPPANGAPSCLTTLRNEIKTMADNYAPIKDPSQTQYLDDWVSIWFMDKLNLRSSVFYSARKATTSKCVPACAPGETRIPACWCNAGGYDNWASSTPPPSPLPISCQSQAPLGNLGYEHWEGLCVNFKVYLDKNCNVVPPSLLGDLRQCSGVNLQFWPSSPISLMWNTSHAITSRGTLVQFQLDKGRKDSWYTWYGSEETPLLVYDPEHKGAVASADQLFGNWTFGGKRSASLSSAAASDAGPWRDGYEALATLDSNGDGEISGGELKPLALWFDKGRDAVAQPGEVVPVSAVGVTKLFVGPGKQDPQTRNVHLKRGFIRRTDAGETVGESVDWFSTGAATQPDLIVKQHLLTEKERAISDISALLPQRPVAAPPSSNRDTVLKVVKDSPVSGAWFWKAKDDVQENSRGVLLIDHVEGDIVYGLTVSEIPVRDPSDKLKSVLSTKAISGKVVKESDGSFKLSFSTVVAPDPMGHKEPPSVSEARLSPNDNTLTGETTELLGPDKNITYQWVATK
jgi:hypothetical protein